jgi:catechol 2,3-dioxygenase-like lactoylglutathione lyase family enzyme
VEQRRSIERGLEVIDHVYISVTDIDRSLTFYLEALNPLGWRAFGTYDAASGPENVPDLFGLGDAAYVSGTGIGSSIWLRRRQPGETGLYLGIVCDTNEAVDAAHAAAINAGGADEGRPADRTYFAPGYYAANAADFDGNRLEFVHKAWNPAR